MCCANIVTSICPCRSMDRTPACEAGNAGSIPARSTLLNKNTPKGVFISLCYLAFAFLIIAASLDFFCDALFFFISPVFAALSRSCCTSLYSA